MQVTSDNTTIQMGIHMRLCQRSIIQFKASCDVILNIDIAVVFTHLPIFDSAMGVINNRYSVNPCIFATLLVSLCSLDMLFSLCVLSTYRNIHVYL